MKKLATLVLDLPLAAQVNTTGLDPSGPPTSTAALLSGANPAALPSIGTSKNELQPPGKAPYRWSLATLAADL